jgi:hypothetical protein
VRRDCHVFINALLPRVIESGPQADAHATRWTLEDAWRNPLVLRCWTRFGLQLDATQAERIVLRASELRLCDRFAVATLAQATEDGASGRAACARERRDGIAAARRPPCAKT